MFGLLGAEAVEHQPYADPRTGAVGQSGGEVVRDPTLPVHEGHHVDGVPSRADRPEHRGEDLISVAQGQQVVSFRGGHEPLQYQQVFWLARSGHGRRPASPRDAG
ncbi:hypothetical protein SRO_0288 [Streptomyces rochei]|nr:hypothetical protein SRO_0288 [Streptomyces rochei]